VTAGVELVRELQRGFQAGDRDAIDAVLHPDFSIEQPSSLPHGGRHHGLEGMGKMGATFAEHWQRTISEPTLIDGGDRVVQVTTQTWTAVATGRSATVDVVELFAFHDSQILEIRVFQQDTHLLLATLEPTG
jgi:ketosteroid isomerase-like protein